MVYDGEVGLSPAELLDRLARLELDDSDDELGVGAPQVAHRGGHERGEGAGEGGQAEAQRRALGLLDRRLGAAERREHALDVRPQSCARARGAQGTLRAIHERDPGLALERGELLGDRRLRVAEDVGGGRDRAEVQHQRERPKPLDVAEAA